MPHLNVQAIAEATAHVSFGLDLRYVPVVDSTNRLASRLPPGSWNTGTILLTDYQQEGRGRQGRSWLAPAGTSILMSVMFMRRMDIQPADYVMMAALAVRDALGRAARVDADIKWPNDILIGDRKVCGILSEHVTVESEERTIVGIGINVDFRGFPRSTLPVNATSLDRESDSSPSREAVVVALIKALELWYGDLTHDPETVYAAWAAALSTTGRVVSVSDGTGTWTGLAAHVRRDGALVVTSNDGRSRIVYAGEVSLRDSQSFTTL